jgi:hypothetical protein
LARLDQVLLCDNVQGQAEAAGSSREVPEDVTEVFRDARYKSLMGCAVPQMLLVLGQQGSSFPSQPEERDEFTVAVVSDMLIGDCCLLLIVGEIHSALPVGRIP